MTPEQPVENYILTTSCPDRTGVVAAITGFVAERGGLITEAAHFLDEYSERSFGLHFAVLGCRFAMNWPASSSPSQIVCRWTGCCTMRRRDAGC
jgi:hypothetical protein